MMMAVVVVVAMAMVSLMVTPVHPLDVGRLRLVAAKHNVTCVLVFGDSSVDPGNNNHLLPGAPKGNFRPYGKDFFEGRPTGRFTDGRLATDIIAEAFGYTRIVRGFLDPHIQKVDLLHGVSFASAGSGYDDLTANFSNALPFWKQVEYFKHYKIRITEMVGREKAEEIINNAMYVISMGTNDFLQNYYLDPTRPKQFTPQQYQDYLISCLQTNIKAMHGVGARRFVVVGVPAFGCMPLVKTLKDENKCDDAYNKVAFSFNSKIKNLLATLKTSLGIDNTFVDIYKIFINAVADPKRYGFEEASKGCCGSGTIEYGDTCRGLSTCADPSKYVFWDAVHPTEKMYKIIADAALQSVLDFVLR